MEMASRVVILVTFMMMLCYQALGQTSGCTSTLVTLSPCLNYVTGNVSTPSSSCCSQLANVVASKPQCLCAMVNGGGSSLGISINQTLAVGLPDACKVKTPPASRCNGVSNAPTPTTSPTSNEPSDSSSNAEPVAPTDSTTTPASTGTSTGGSKTVPTTTSTTSDASINDVQLISAAILMVFLASNVIGF